jgi:hypothetical protein
MSKASGAVIKVAVGNEGEGEEEGDGLLVGVGAVGDCVVSVNGLVEGEGDDGLGWFEFTWL